MKRLGILACMSAFAISGFFSAWFVAIAAIMFFVAPAIIWLSVWAFLFYKSGAFNRFRVKRIKS